LKNRLNHGIQWEVCLDRIQIGRGLSPGPFPLDQTVSNILGASAGAMKAIAQFGRLFYALCLQRAPRRRSPRPI